MPKFKPIHLLPQSDFYTIISNQVKAHGKKEHGGHFFTKQDNMIKAVTQLKKHKNPALEAQLRDMLLARANYYLAVFNYSGQSISSDQQIQTYKENYLRQQRAFLIYLKSLDAELASTIKRALSEGNIALDNYKNLNNEYLTTLLTFGMTTGHKDKPNIIHLSHEAVKIQEEKPLVTTPLQPKEQVIAQLRQMNIEPKETYTDPFQNKIIELNEDELENLKKVTKTSKSSSLVEETKPDSVLLKETLLKSDSENKRTSPSTQEAQKIISDSHVNVKGRIRQFEVAKELQDANVNVKKRIQDFEKKTDETRSNVQARKRAIEAQEMIRANRGEGFVKKIAEQFPLSNSKKPAASTRETEAQPLKLHVSENDKALAIRLQIEEAAGNLGIHVNELKEIYYPGLTEAEIAKHIQEQKLQENDYHLALRLQANELPKPEMKTSPKTDEELAKELQEQEFDAQQKHEKVHMHFYAFHALQRINQVSIQMMYDAASNRFLFNFAISQSINVLQCYGMSINGQILGSTYQQYNEVSSVHGSITGTLTQKDLEVDGLQIGALTAGLADTNGLLKGYGQLGLFAAKAEFDLSAKSSVQQSPTEPVRRVPVK
ncbi:hypothetical protein [Legionella israelensis]|uniref:Uncharacterized protein n=1 Tax=Legionella israelensis TaxID=454 RepID=A0A0W0WEE5_9GAMM|nr:hypothetical protein [Legionella israelensis]KTD30696.1 hypothetical protein Lisr_0682 [Legionella israelensis]QBS09830.1 hypothetical protein E4T55_08140 [Legionella israelensis]SCY13599.1 hypothetical protein SAMN02746069_01406 [Legionella israelensis DSM 19235]STX59388.1 Uncharacterised protein [Legionella israelensis]